MTSLVGTNLGRYRIVQFIQGEATSSSGSPDPGQSGAISDIYKAVDPQSKLLVAIKVFPPNLVHDHGRLQRLQESLRLVAQLNHPGIPPIVGSGMIHGRPYIVMPFLGAGSLADRYASGMAWGLPPSQVLDEIAGALDHAHKFGVVHGELNPSKLLFDAESGSIGLIGLGEMVVRSSSPEAKPPTSTPGADYHAPEVISHQPATPRSDQYSFGVLALELLTHKPAGEALALLRSRSYEKLAGRGEPGNGGSRRIELHPKAADILLRMIAENPLERFPTVAEANRALQVALGYKAPETKPEPSPAPARPPTRRRRAGLVWVTGLIIAIGLVAAIPAFSAGLIRLPWNVAADGQAGSVSQPVGGPDILLPPEVLAAGSTPGASPEGGDPSADGAPLSDSGDPQASPTASAGSGGNGDGGVLPTALPTQVPSPTATSAVAATSTDVPPSTSTAPAPTNLPPPTSTPPAPTVAPTTGPDINPNACKDDPSHKNYCTPTPSP